MLLVNFSFILCRDNMILNTANNVKKVNIVSNIVNDEVNIQIKVQESSIGEQLKIKLFDFHSLLEIKYVIISDKKEKNGPTNLVKNSLSPKISHIKFINQNNKGGL